jgi:small multidrug resistance pump
MPYVYLALAIAAEVIGMSALKSSQQFTRLLPSALALGAYGTTLYFLSLALKSIPMGIAYAIWSGAGMILITLSGIVFFRQIPDVAALLGIALIIAGVLIINLFSKMVAH